MHRIEIDPNENKSGRGRRMPRPDWLKIKAPGGKNFAEIRKMMRSKSLHTVCEEARCPNMSECWDCGTATFMILGETCVRNCRFCAVGTKRPGMPDPNEPINVAESVKQMKLKHTVITSVTRDDLPDGGSEHWAKTIREVKRVNPGITLEVLIPDFKGDLDQLQNVIDEKPDVLNHNVETVPRLYKTVRPQANYQTSLNVLSESERQGMRTKTGIMVGLGETFDEIIEVMKDLRSIDVKILTIGQYLQPSKEHLAVDRYVDPKEFAEYKKIGLKMGFEHVEASPLVRSSYHAENHVD